MSQTVAAKETRSFRGQPIPQLIKRQTFEITEGESIMEIYSYMTDVEKKDLTIDAIRFEDNLPAYCKLSTGEVVTIETAIALAEAGVFTGYTVGTTMNKGRTLKCRPNKATSVYKLPRF